MSRTQATNSLTDKLSGSRVTLLLELSMAFETASVAFEQQLPLMVMFAPAVLHPFTVVGGGKVVVETAMSPCVLPQELSMIMEAYNSWGVHDETVAAVAQQMRKLPAEA